MTAPTLLDIISDSKKNSTASVCVCVYGAVTLAGIDSRVFVNSSRPLPLGT